jgi:hypothetical protein
MSEKRNLRIFCPIHEASFEVAENVKIQCEITGHSLSADFPYAEFWEFCCNCGTYSPSKLGRGEKVRATCFSCQNEVSKRFLCATCKVLSFECGTQAKGKSYFVTPGGMEPHCPGCGETAITGGAVIRHLCKDIDAEILTGHESCPFCLEKTASISSPNDPLNAPTGRCPACSAAIVPGAAFCGKCKHRLRSDLSTEKLGTDITKSQLFGSLCPNCSTPIVPGSGYCAECGQAVKISSKVPPPPPPPPPGNRRSAPAGTTETQSASAAAVPVITTPKSPPILKILGVSVLGLILLIVIVAGLRSGSPAPNSNAHSTLPVNTPTPVNRGPSTNSNSGLPSTFDERAYKGTISSKSTSFSMTLTKNGSELTGTATTPGNWDTLEGTIDSSGHFEVSGYEKGDMGKNKGKYIGQITSEGKTITGKWSNMTDTKESDFTVYEQ